MIDFDDTQSLGHQSNEDIADYLEAIGDVDGARELRSAGVRGQALGIFEKPWKQTTHLIGFVDTLDNLAAPRRLPIEAALTAAADRSLIGKQVKVTLDAFQVHEYPGLGQHKVLFDFAGRDQAGGKEQDLQFASVLYVDDGARAATSGVPIFTGLTVPGEGLAFKARTITLRNEGDQAIIDVLGSSVFNEGLKLLGQVQPALPQLVALAGGIAKNLLERPKNKQVQLFELGLDFSSTATSARLRLGSYVVVQVPGANGWDWNSWYYDRHQMSVVDGDGNITPHNVIIFSVALSESDTACSGTRLEGEEALKQVTASPGTA